MLKQTVLMVLLLSLALASEARADEVASFYARYLEANLLNTSVVECSEWVQEMAGALRLDAACIQYSGAGEYSYLGIIINLDSALPRVSLVQEKPWELTEDGLAYMSAWLDPLNRFLILRVTQYQGIATVELLVVK